MTPQEASEILEIDISNIGIMRGGYTKGVSHDTYNEAVGIAREALQFQQSVVRCKDCVHRQYGTRCEYWSTDTTWFGKYVEDTDYCSNGERRDEE